LWLGGSGPWAVVRNLFFYLTGVFIFLGGGMLPDIDSPKSTPSQLARQVTNTLFVVLFSAIAASICLFGFSMSAVEMLPYLFSAVVLAVAFNWLFSYYMMRELTDHRGHTHSIGAALLYAVAIGGIFAIGAYAGAVVFWLPLMMGSMAFFGYMSHLFCDEIFSAFKEESKEEAESKFRNWLFSWRHIWFDSDGKKKSSAGSAFKWW
jgi:hypothetical protein